MRHHTVHLPLLERQAAALAAAATAVEQAAQAGGDGSKRTPQNRLSLPAVADMVWGLSLLGHTPTLLLDELPLALASWQRATATQGTSLIALGTATKLAWALSAAGCLHHSATEAVAKALAAAAERVSPTAKLSSVSLRQLHQFRLALQAEVKAEAGGGGGGSGSGVESSTAGSSPAAAALRVLQDAPAAAALLPAAAKAWAAPATPIVSACQADVAAAARGLGLAVKEEHEVVPGLLGGSRVGCWVVGRGWVVDWLARLRAWVAGCAQPLDVKAEGRLVEAVAILKFVSLPFSCWQSAKPLSNRHLRTNPCPCSRHCGAPPAAGHRGGWAAALLPQPCGRAAAPARPYPPEAPPGAGAGLAAGQRASGQLGGAARRAGEARGAAGGH